MYQTCQRLESLTQKATQCKEVYSLPATTVMLDATTSVTDSPTKACATSLACKSLSRYTEADRHWYTDCLVQDARQADGGQLASAPQQSCACYYVS